MVYLNFRISMVKSYIGLAKKSIQKGFLHNFFTKTYVVGAH